MVIDSQHKCSEQLTKPVHWYF